METIEIVGHRCMRLPAGEEGEPSTAVGITFDLDEDRAMTITSSNDILFFDTDMTQVENTVCTTPMGKPVALAHVGMLDAVYATTDTEMFVVHRGQPEAEYVGSIDCGILAAAWSPDQELLVVINGDGDIVCLSKDLDPIFEHPVVSDEFGADAPVNVGWGKRETQFQGRAGKLANQPKVQDAQVPHDDGAPRIAWRGDGQLFATSTLENNRRVIRTWQRDGTLSATSEKVGGLEQALAWRPSGNLIASTQRLPHRHDVVFFERNGLRHGEFTLPFAQGEVHVEKLAWNCESNILAVWAVALDNGEYATPPAKSYLQLWTSSNYHWYLQHEFRFENGGSDGLFITAFDWHPEDPHRLVIATNTHASQFILRRTTVDSGMWQSNAKHSSVVAVPDGSALQITPLRRVVVPPPMADSTLALTAPIHSCVAPASVSAGFSAAVERNELRPLAVGDVMAAVSSDHTLSLWGRVDHPTKRHLIASCDLRDVLPSSLPAALRVYRHATLCDDVLFITTLTHADGDAGNHDNAETSSPSSPPSPSSPSSSPAAQVSTRPPAVDTVHALHMTTTNADGAQDRDATAPTHTVEYIGCVCMATPHVHVTACAPLPTAMRSVIVQDQHGHLTRVHVAPRHADGGRDDGALEVVMGPCVQVPRLAAACSRIVCLMVEDDNTTDAPTPAAITTGSKSNSTVGTGTTAVGDEETLFTIQEDSDDDDDDDNNEDDNNNGGNSANTDNRDAMMPPALAVVGLTNAFQLVVNEHVVVSDCNSFAHNHDFLVFTTHAHVCRFLRLCRALTQQPQLLLHQQQQQHHQQQPEQLDKASSAVKRKNNNSSGGDGDDHVYDHSTRAVERGSRLVCVPRHDIKVVLQMPRGNLEVICPRPLILSRAKTLLNKHAYADVFFMLRKHRLSLNLLYDHNPGDFEAHVVAFVRALHSSQHLNLFVMELRDEDVTQTMYTIAYQPRSSGSGVPANKTARVCELLRNACVSVNEDGLLDTILTTFIKVQPGGIERALERVLAIHNTPVPAGTGHASANEDRARAALKYMLLLVDVDVLYNEALGSYNLEFALMVAQVAQKDPKQYLPFLNALRQESEVLRRYRIDLHLKRFHKALQHLSNAGPAHFEECLALMKEHELYPEAMRIFRDHDASEVRAVAGAYGQHLLAKREYNQAGILLERAGLYDVALKAYVHALNWRQVFSLTSLRAVPREEVKKVAVDMSEALVGVHRFHDAAHVLHVYGDDATAAAELYVKGKHWDDACLLASQQQQQQQQGDAIMRNIVSPGVLAALRTMCEQYTDMSALIAKRTERLCVVRAGKLEDRRLEALGLLPGDDGEFGDAADGAASDLYSEASTARSRRSGRTRATRTSQRSRRTAASSARSSKGRRKHQAKKYSLKEGGMFEEEALVHALRKLVVQVDKDQDVVRETLLAGLRMGHDDAVDSLQEAYDACRHTIQACMPRIWPPPSTLVHRLPLGVIRFLAGGTSTTGMMAAATGPIPGVAGVGVSGGFESGSVAAHAQALLEQQRAMHAPHLTGTAPATSMMAPTAATITTATATAPPASGVFTSPGPAYGGPLLKVHHHDGNNYDGGDDDDDDGETMQLAARPDFKPAHSWRVITEKHRKTKRK
ncbi:hypothetical protein PTSG_10180 [Salpingoeca rosetta]|uniref:Elongator complex protein 1 n=1 Tax=Salpingoeca rosetta (strain ATCC 50818 / BSB-021) TaxID=946362 RepID=F2UQJ1_SALR5|nr:uncharacterized protein PTSG_10180 [Salpingoeca rosetta]EGD79896.1 hypothetical protein PTSG_10180 [Salpingoeca rosetta]|eukprot:XP_004988517.1 hypothetical protein PTSG_10180 [Salpingoeca rosetta]